MTLSYTQAQKNESCLLEQFTTPGQRQIKYTSDIRKVKAAADTYAWLEDLITNRNYLFLKRYLPEIEKHWGMPSKMYIVFMNLVYWKALADVLVYEYGRGY